MTALSEVELRQCLAQVPDPHSGQPLSELISAVAIREGRVALVLTLPYPAAGWHAALAALVRTELSALSGVEAVTVDIDTQIATHAVQGGLAPVPGIGNIIAVASGKGGVGKSTVAANLALALQAEGARVGVLDADVYGPSMPRMLGLLGEPEATANQLLPLRAHGLQAMSIGNLVKADQAMIWRGPIATQALQQMLNQTAWDALDYLIIDLPPGTGDIQLTLAQRIPVAGAVVVTTPQDVALDDVRRAVAMFGKVNIPMLGLVENMSVFVCPKCGHQEAVFGHGGGDRMAADHGLTVLGQIPLVTGLGRSTDRGQPLVVAEPDHPVSQCFLTLARRTAAILAQQARNQTVRMPSIKIVD